MAVLLALVSNIRSQTLPDYIPTDGLLGWWPFTGNANDESGNGNDGIVNGAVLTIDRFGAESSAYQFNGLDQNISGTISGLTGLVENTLTIWMKYTGDAGGQPYDTFYQLGEYGIHTFGYGYDYSGQNLNFYSFCTGGIESYPVVDLNDDWHFVAIVDNEAGTALYIDGVLFESGLGGPAGDCYQGSPAFEIGGGSDNQWVTGNLDDIGFWNRALTAEEIYAIYHACTLEVIADPEDGTVTAGSDAMFTVQSSEAGSSYQWQTDLGVGFQDLNEVGQYVGVNSDTLNVLNTTLGNDNQPFRCIVQSGGCLDTSAVAVLYVSENVGITNSNANNEIFIWPNPFTDQVHIKLNQKIQNGWIWIYNSEGKMVLREQMQETEQDFEFGGLAPGIYNLRVGENISCIIIKSK
ncbi:MAG: LamG-like jellyroll fold domain-containing protein [Chitinophagales bacterium]